MDLETTDNKLMDGLIFLFLGLGANKLWEVLFTGSVHTLGAIITVLLSGFVGYMAKNFWFPYWFPEKGKWKAFNFLNPNRNK